MPDYNVLSAVSQSVRSMGTKNNIMGSSESSRTIYIILHCCIAKCHIIRSSIITRSCSVTPHRSMTHGNILATVHILASQNAYMSIINSSILVISCVITNERSAAAGCHSIPRGHAHESASGMSCRAVKSTLSHSNITRTSSFRSRMTMASSVS